MSSQDPSAPFSRVNFGAGGQLTRQEIRWIIRKLKAYLAEYPTNDEDLRARFAEEVKSWEIVLETSKIVVSFQLGREEEKNTF